MMFLREPCVLPRRQILDQLEILEHEPQVVATEVCATALTQGRRIGSVHNEASVVGGIEQAENVEQGRLTGATGSADE